MMGVTKNASVTVRTTTYMKEELEMDAVRKGISLSDLIREIFNTHIKENKVRYNREQIKD